MEKIFFLYKIVNTKNNKIYIGQTVQPEKRWNQHKNDSAKSNPSMSIARAIKKYGNENFTFELLAGCKTLESANEIEEYLIKQYESHVSTGKGYNISFGGLNAQRVPMSEQQKKILSEIKKGKKLSPQHIQNISNSLKGKPAHNRGQSRSTEVKNKISETMKGIIFSEEHKNNLSAALQGKKYSEETIQKMRKPKSEVAKLNMSKARKRYLENKKNNESIKNRGTLGN
jgi:group I intron endonuclease